MPSPKAIIHLNRLVNNFNMINESLKNQEIMPVMKANAYGHGAVDCAKALERAGCNYFSVFTIDEGLELRNAGIDSNILILSKLDISRIQEAVDKNLTLNVSSINDVDSIIIFLEQNGLSPKFHLKIETGMTRLGFELEEISAVIKKLMEFKNLKCEGIYTHFATSDEGDLSFAIRQKEKFQNAIESAIKLGFNFTIKHISNSGGLLNDISTDTEIIRLGILLFGIYPSNEVPKKFSLQPVLEFKAPIIDVRKVNAGTRVSYGGLYKVKKKSNIGIIQCGFADGFPRPWYEKGFVSYRGKYFKIAGRVCMDQFMVDFGNYEPNIGDDVLIFGSNSNDEILVETICKEINTSPYVVTAALKGRTQWSFQSD